jgi:hypothetical protein
MWESLLTWHLFGLSFAGVEGIMPLLTCDENIGWILESIFRVSCGYENTFEKPYSCLVYVRKNHDKNIDNCIVVYTDGVGFRNTPEKAVTYAVNDVELNRKLGTRYEDLYVQAVRNFWLPSACSTDEHGRFVSFQTREFPF